MRDEDALDVIELIGGVFGEYSNCILDVDGEMPELRRIASWVESERGELWVAVQAWGEHERVVGMGGYTRKSGGAEVRKLYVHRHARRTGLGGQILERIERAATARGAAFIELWSDTKFVTAHRFYERRGYIRGPHTRALHDKSDTIEFYFRKDLLASEGGAP
ncbi:MAG: GNAT family N-acetyltransferase [Polyangiaceae bacterium]